MESKVSQNGDILIEEMIEKLKKVSMPGGSGFHATECFGILPPGTGDGFTVTVLSKERYIYLV